MVCRGHQGLGSCYFPEKSNSFWGLCQSCEFIENRLFLEAVQQTLKEDKSQFTFHGKEYSLEDPEFPKKYLRYSQFNPNHNDPRLSLLKLCYVKNKPFFQEAIQQFSANSGFLLSANLLFRKHLPQKQTCSMLGQIQQKINQYFLDLPSCPCCMSKVLCRIQKPIGHRQIQHIYGIFRNQILSQHPTWFVHVFRLLQTIWEQDLENEFTFQRLYDYSFTRNPITLHIEFRDWLGAFLETPVVIEKYLMGRISEQNLEYLLIHTGQELNFQNIRKQLRKRSYLFKEDLIIKTWHPKRLFPWCLDMEELQEFGVWPFNPDQFQNNLTEVDH